MLIFNIAILIIFLIGFLISLKYSPNWMKSIDKKEHKLYFLYPLSDWVLSKTGLYRILRSKDRVTNSIKALYVTSKPELIQKLFWCSRISLVISVLLLFNFLSLLGILKNFSDSILIDGIYIQRPLYGEGNKEVELEVTMEQENKNSSNYDNAPISQDVTLNIEEKSYNEKELDEMFSKSMDYLKVCVLGENKSSKQIDQNLNFIETIPGTSITVEWRPENYNLIQTDGTVNNKEISVEGVETSVTAILSYRKHKTECKLHFIVIPRQYSEAELLQNELKKEVESYSEKTSEDNYLELPDSLDKYSLSWSGKKDNSGVTIFFVGIIIAVAVWLVGDQELEKQMKKRKEQMLIDYPEIINKFTLLVNAGMTVKQAWNKIADDYGSKSGDKNKDKRYAYEEMLITAHELQLGLPENIAYEQYGRRIGLIPYIKFSSLISQNLKKGNKGFTELLMKEAIEAFEDRKEIAKRLGEEAGTKLLIPMMVMLIIVFLMIMIPAFQSFQL